MHSECSSLTESSDAKAVCLLCKEDQQPVAKPCLMEVQTSEETTIQTGADTVTEDEEDLVKEKPEQKRTLETDQSGDEPEKETPMDLGKFEFSLLVLQVM